MSFAGVEGDDLVFCLENEGMILNVVMSRGGCSLHHDAISLAIVANEWLYRAVFRIRYHGPIRHTG